MLRKFTACNGSTASKPELVILNVRGGYYDVVFFFFLFPFRLANPDATNAHTHEEKK